MKRFFTLVLTLTLLVSSVTAITANAYLSNVGIAEGFTYKVLENKYAMITGITSSKSYQIKDVLEFPEELDGYPVKYIAEDFSRRLCYDGDYDPKYLKKIIIPDTVTYIGEYAFAFDSGSDYYDFVSGVETIKLSSNLTYIGESAFEYNTKLKEINIPDTVTYLGNGAFLYCNSLEEVYIPGTVRVWEPLVFAYCDNLKKVTIGEGIERIPKGAFRGCKSLKKVNLPHSLRFIEESAFYNCTSLKSIKLYSDVLLGKDVFAYYTNKKGKRVYDKNFKIKVIEDRYNNLSNAFYLPESKSTPVFYMEADPPEKQLYSSTPSASKQKKVKLKIQGKEVKKWTSSNPNVAKITANGKLRIISKGKTIITATLKDGTIYKRKLKIYNK